MSKRLLYFILFTVFLAFSVLQSACNRKMQTLKKPMDGLAIAFYNVENLFDTIDDPRTNDSEFLPNAKVAWNTERYFHKLNQIAKVIAAMNTPDFPHILGLSEVENRRVLEDLVKVKSIAPASYDIIHIDDTDPRGIEVAMLYRPEYFKPLHHEALVHVRKRGGRSRHILYVKGITMESDTLHIFVNHWTSRFGGQEASAPSRNNLARFLRETVDSLFQAIPNPNIIICGDFNDNPDDPSLFSYLKALAPSEEVEPATLYNLAMIPYLEGEGTIYYRGWDFFDQFIVSSPLIDTKSNLTSSPLEVIKKDWMLFKPRGGEPRPDRTQSGGKYHGGFSDHLPVMIKLYQSKSSK